MEAKKIGKVKTMLYKEQPLLRFRSSIFSLHVPVTTTSCKKIACSIQMFLNELKPTLYAVFTCDNVIFSRATKTNTNFNILNIFLKNQTDTVLLYITAKHYNFFAINLLKLPNSHLHSKANSIFYLLLAPNVVMEV